MKNELLTIMGYVIHTADDLETIPGSKVIDIDRLVSVAVEVFGWKDCSKVRKAAQAAIDESIADSKWTSKCWLLFIGNVCAGKWTSASMKKLV